MLTAAEKTMATVVPPCSKGSFSVGTVFGETHAKHAAKFLCYTIWRRAVNIVEIIILTYFLVLVWNRAISRAARDLDESLAREDDHVEAVFLGYLHRIPADRRLQSLTRILKNQRI